jgi:DNA polymerase III epsilon subunit-like protein
MTCETCFEAYISVDIETAGPNPSHYSLLSIGACLVTDLQRTFYVELQPVNGNSVTEALAVHGLSLEELTERGLPPAEALARFEDWLAAEVPADHRPVFVAFNAPFDWMFVNDYFHRFLGRNPFGHAALDLKAFYMALTGVCWSETSMGRVAARYLGGRQLSHHALQDALNQAELFQKMLAEASPF